MKVEKIDTEIAGCYILKLTTFSDLRGGFTKLFHDETFKSYGLADNFKEEYFSTSKKKVLRGLHFQLPPHDHAKCVSCLKGSVLDVGVDLRKNSPTYKKHIAIELSAEEPVCIYLPAGIAHGFYTFEDDTIILNRTTTVYDAQSDFGIKWDTCGIKWPDDNPILSERDSSLISLDEFQSPF